MQLFNISFSIFLINQGIEVKKLNVKRGVKHVK